MNRKRYGYNESTDFHFSQSKLWGTEHKGHPAQHCLFWQSNKKKTTALGGKWREERIVLERCKRKYQIIIPRGIEHERHPVECHRDAFNDGYCYFHSSSADKNIAIFLNEIRRLSEEQGRFLDLSYFEFPVEPFVFPVAIRKNLVCEHTEFRGDVSFAGHSFAGYTSFHSAVFYGEADFRPADGDPYHKQTKFKQKAVFNNVRFMKKADFAYCVFEAIPEFNGTIFHDLAVFSMANVDSGSPLMWLAFQQCEFQGDAFLEIRLKGPTPGIAFESCNLEGVRFSTLPIDDDVKLRFKDIKKWNEEKKRWQAPRNKVKDESDKNVSGVELVQLYNLLESYFYKDKDFSLARDFYIGQMVSMRRDKNYGKVPKVVNFLYQVVSKYGDAILRPIIALLVVLLAAPAILLLAGASVTRSIDDSALTETVTVNYDLFSPGTSEYYWSDYKSAFVANLALSTLDRKNEMAPAPDSLQKGMLIGESLLLVVIASLLVVATRRKFTPKKPVGQ